MAFKLDNQLLEELGLAALSPQEKQAMLRQILETLEMRVGTTLASRMSDAQLDEFERLMPAEGDNQATIQSKEQQALQWLETNFPNYKQVVNDELEKLKAEIKEAAPQILANSSPQPGPAMPSASASPYPSPSAGMSPAYNPAPAPSPPTPYMPSAPTSAPYTPPAPASYPGYSPAPQPGYSQPSISSPYAPQNPPGPVQAPPASDSSSTPPYQPMPPQNGSNPPYPPQPPYPAV